jgi:acetyltransferase-like isoleucine patch superfamily enzyme
MKIVNTIEDLNKFLLSNGFVRTSSIANPKNDSVVFIRDKKYLENIFSIKKNVFVILDELLLKNVGDVNNYITVHTSKYPEYEFTLFHNATSKYKYVGTKIGSYGEIHDTAIIGEDGFKYVNGPDGDKVRFIHTGGLIIGDDVDIGAYTMVQRGTLDDTVIEDGVKIGNCVNVGHNCIISKNTVIAPHSVVSGSTFIGENCWLGVGCLIRNHLSICDNVVIGMGSVVIRDIARPGIYAGNPAKWVRRINEDFNL